MYDPIGLGNILRKLADKMDDYEPDAAVCGRIMDDHGNQVGSYKRE
jgi:hypothetical protein